MATRLNDPSPVFYGTDGVTPLAGGSIVFSDTGTTNLGSTITLNSAGRPTVGDVWLVGPTAYRMVFKDSVGGVVRSKDDCRDLTSATSYTLPNPASGTAGQVLTTTGAAYALATVLALPDPTGSPSKMVVADATGTSYILQTQPAATTYSSTSLPGGVVDSAASYQVGKRLVQYGSDTAPTAAATNTTRAVTFATAYAAAPSIINITVTADNITPAGALVSHSITSKSTTGFTVKFYAGQEHGGNDWFITTAVTFDYEASGRVA